MSHFNWVGAQALEDAGGGIGWMSYNSGRNQLNATFVDHTYSMNTDCSVSNLPLEVHKIGDNEPERLLHCPIAHCLPIRVVPSRHIAPRHV